MGGEGELNVPEGAWTVEEEDDGVFAAAVGQLHGVVGKIGHVEGQAVGLGVALPLEQFLQTDSPCQFVAAEDSAEIAVRCPQFVPYGESVGQQADGEFAIGITEADAGSAVSASVAVSQDEVAVVGTFYFDSCAVGQGLCVYAADEGVVLRRQAVADADALADGFGGDVECAVGGAVAPRVAGGGGKVQGKYHGRFFIYAGEGGGRRHGSCRAVGGRGGGRRCVAFHEAQQHAAAVGGTVVAPAVGHLGRLTRCQGEAAGADDFTSRAGIGHAGGKGAVAGVPVAGREETDVAGTDADNLEDRDFGHYARLQGDGDFVREIFTARVVPLVLGIFIEGNFQVHGGEKIKREEQRQEAVSARRRGGALRRCCRFRRPRGLRPRRPVPATAVAGGATGARRPRGR